MSKESGKGYKGSTIKPIRFPDELLARIERAMESREKHASVLTGSVADFSAWIRKAVEDKLDHLDRAKRSSKRRNKSNGQATQVQCGDDAAAGTGEPRPDQYRNADSFDPADPAPGVDGRPADADLAISAVC